ncbi:TPA: cellulose synthase [Citrobacter freundii]|nr:cellulose synthase [Citrobacter freundii]
MSDNIMLTWFREQQITPGWFDLVTLMTESMIQNAGENDSQRFLAQIGKMLAIRFPLPESETLEALENNINKQLAEFHWGVVELGNDENKLIFHHQALPSARDEYFREVWCRSFCAVLEGMYEGWMQALGASSRLTIFRETSTSTTEVRFNYCVKE